MSYVLWQMVNVHGRWTHIRERKKIGDDDDASLWPGRRRQQIELAIMCLSSCLARESKRASEWTNERKKGFSWSSGLTLYARTRLHLSLSTPDDSVKKSKNAATNSFSSSFSFFFTLSIYVHVRTGSISWPWTMTSAFLFSSSLFFVWFLCSTTSKKKKERERTRKNSI